MPLGNLPSVNPDRINVCHIASGDRWAGAEAQLASLLKALARDGELNLWAILLNEGRLAEEVRRGGVTVQVLPESTLGFFRILSEAARFLEGKEVQVLHSHRYKENLLAGCLARRLRIPIVLRTQHGLPEPFQGLRDLRQGMIQRLDRLVARWATDGVISVSHRLTEELGKRFGAGKICTIHNGIDLEEVRSSLTMAEAKRRLGVPADCPLVGAVGRLEPVKRLDLFLAAAQLIHAGSRDTRFLIVGEGSEETRLRELARQMGLTDHVSFLGHRHDVYDVLRALDLFVLCSDHEGLPIVLLEALCLGVAVVARRVGGVSEVIEAGRDGVLIDSGDPRSLAEACLDLLDDVGRRARLGQAGALKVAENFSVETTAAQVKRLYTSFFESRQR